MLGLGTSSVRKGMVLTSSGIPSRITCNEQIPGTCPWYNDERTPETEEKGQKEIKNTEKGRNERITRQRKHQRTMLGAQGAGRIPGGQGCCLLERSIV